MSVSNAFLNLTALMTVYICLCWFQTDLVGEPEIASLVQRLRVGILAYDYVSRNSYLILQAFS